MGLKGKLTIETEIKGSAEKYYNIMKEQVHHFSNISDKIGAVELHDGDWHEDGAVKNWTYTINGKTETLKEKITHDDVNKLVVVTAVDGDVLKVYKDYKGIFQAISGGGHGGKDTVKVSLEYEKMKESDPAPVHYFEFLINIFIEEFDEYLVKA